MFSKVTNLSRVKVSTKLYGMAIAVVLAFAGFSWVFYDTMNTIKIHGPIYKDIVKGKDLIADILPPPEYIIESYLLVLESAQKSESSEVKPLYNRFIKLKEEYYLRHDVWVNSLTDGQLKQELTNQSFVPAKQFYEVAESHFFPLLMNQNIEEAKAVLKNELSPLYEAHRAAIDKTVVDASKWNVENETIANQIIESRIQYLWIIGFVICSGLFSLCILLIRQLLSQLGGEPSEVYAITQQIAEGNLQVELDSKRKQQGIYGAISSMTQQLNSLITTIVKSAKTIEEGVTQINQVMHHISQGASEQAASIEEISSSLEEFASITSQNTQNANDTLGVAQKSSERIENSAMIIANLSDAIQKITNKTDIVTTIANQTNLLALNAAIEASRAGEHGRGFAVVAGEVRRLAEQCRQLANEINLITHQSIEVAGEAVVQFQGVVPEIKRTSMLVSEIAVSSSEQKTGIGQINSSVQVLNQVTQQNAAGAEQMASSVEELAEQAFQLRKMVQIFKLK
jgi:methyl-accepting chemotaxis protein